MRRFVAFAVVTWLGLAPAGAQRVELRIGPGVTDGPTTGRAFVIFTRDESREPRLQAGSYAGSAPVFGLDVSGLRPDEPAVIDASTLGFPLKSLREIPAGEYLVQGLLNVYTQVTPKHGKTIWVHWDQWEGQQWNRSPGNLVSEVQRVRWDPTGSALQLTLTRKLSPVEVPPDTRWVKRLKIQSKILTEWWGRPVYLGAVALLPRGWEANPTTRYPAIYIQGHFGLGAPFGFNPDGQPETAEARAARLQRTSREPGYEFAQAWMGPNFPRMVAITFQHPTPFYDDSYAVNSANQGPYGDALIQELIPYLEQEFRLIPRSYARLLTGGSTGGWEALALQIYHPDFFGGTWAMYPDGVDFSRNQMIDNYADTNAFMPNAAAHQWLVPERYMSRGEDGQPRVTVRQMAQLEEVLGSRVRGGQQLQAYDAVYGPVGDDGYPKPLFNRKTGTIDKEVAAYWKDQGYDLNHYLQRNWARIGRQLAGKIRVYTGDMDNFYLNLAVYRLEETLKAVSNPRANAVFEYGRPMKPHGWQPFTNAELVRLMAREVSRRAGL
jgi:S-formylglutathione hydrolase FrmB